MNIEKLIDGLKNSKGPDNCHDCALGYWALMGATALSTLQAENERLRDEVERKRRSADDSQHLYENAERAYIKVLAELEQVKRERNEAIKTIFQWTGCPECKHWNSEDEWCEKHDREADSFGGCDSPEWRGPDKED